MDLLSELAVRLSGEPHYGNLQNDLFGLGVPCDPSLADFDRAVANGFRARADARMGRGEYHLALADYGRAMNTSPRNFGLPRNPEVDALRREAQDNLTWFFQSGGDAENVPAEASASVRAAIRSARLPSGHVVVADNGGILAAYHLTDEGREAAVAHADALAADPEARFRIDNLYLAENDDFDTVVYACANGKAVEVHRAPPLEPSPINMEKVID